MKQKFTLIRNIFAKSFGYLFDFIVVFTGVFLAFWLNDKREQRINETKKQEIYIAIYEDLNSFHESGKEDFDKGFINLFRSLDEEFDSLRQAKQLPLRLRIYGDYWKIDIIQSLIASGYLKDIDLETYKRVTRFNTVHQNFLQSIEDYNAMYNQYITANFGKGMDTFYKPGTNELKPEFEYFNHALHEIEQSAILLVDGAKLLSENIKKNKIKSD